MLPYCSAMRMPSRLGKATVLNSWRPHLTTEGGRGASWRICAQNRQKSDVVVTDGVFVGFLEDPSIHSARYGKQFLSTCLFPHSSLNLPSYTPAPSIYQGCKILYKNVLIHVLAIPPSELFPVFRVTFSRHESKMLLCIASWLFRVISMKSSNDKESDRLPRSKPVSEKEQDRVRESLGSSCSALQSLRSLGE